MFLKISGSFWLILRAVLTIEPGRVTEKRSGSWLEPPLILFNFIKTMVQKMTYFLMNWTKIFIGATYVQSNKDLLIVDIIKLNVGHSICQLICLTYGQLSLFINE